MPVTGCQPPPRCSGRRTSVSFSGTNLLDKEYFPTAIDLSGGGLGTGTVSVVATPTIKLINAIESAQEVRRVVAERAREDRAERHLRSLLKWLRDHLASRLRITYRGAPRTVAETLAQAREGRGAIDLETTETYIVCDPNGRIEKILEDRTLIPGLLHPTSEEAALILARKVIHDIKAGRRDIQGVYNVAVRAAAGSGTR